MPATPPSAVQPSPVAGVPVLDGFKGLLQVLFPPELRTAYRGATPQELLRLYGLRVAGLVLLALLVKSYAYGIVSVLAVGMMVCLVVGLKNPNSFRWAFGEKTSRATVGWTLGGLLFGLGLIGSNMEPKAVSLEPIVASASALVTAPVAAPVTAPAPTSAPVQKSAAQERAEVAKDRATQRAIQTQVRAQVALAEAAAEKRQAKRDAIAAAQAKTAAEREALPSQSNTVPDSNPAPDSALVTEETSDVSRADEWEPDGGQESYRNPSTLKVLLTVQHVGDTSSPIVVKVGNNDFTTWGQTTVTLNYDLLYSLKKASVAAQLNYFYSFPSLKSGQQKTIPMTAFRNAEGRAFDPDQYRLRRIFVESKTLEGRKTWDAHPS